MSITLVQQPDQDPNPPAWLASVITAEQAIFNANYQSALTVYNQAVSDWVAANTINRNDGLPITAPPTIPVMQIAYAATGNVFKQYSAAPDPSIQAPVLAAPVTPQPSVPFTSGAAANTDTQNAMLQTILTTVLAIQTKVGA